MEVEACEVGSCAAEETCGASLSVGVVDEDVDVFDLREVADDFGVDPGDWLKFSGPVLRVVGPGDPGGGVRRPLGGHAVAGVIRGAHLCSLFLWEGTPLHGRKVCKVFHSCGLGLDFISLLDKLAALNNVWMNWSDARDLR